jgi:antitoxin CptB
MTGTTLTSAALPPRRRQTLFRAWHRGTREMDLIMGRFADAHLVAMTEDELRVFEHLMEAPDDELFTWITGKNPVPPDYDSGLFRRLVAYQSSVRP